MGPLFLQLPPWCRALHVCRRIGPHDQRFDRTAYARRDGDALRRRDSKARIDGHSSPANSIQLLLPTHLPTCMLNHRLVLIWIALACVIIGCSSAKKGPICHPVHGKVTSKGKPLAEAMVLLHRKTGDVEGNQKPMAIVRADGAFDLTTYRPGDGAPLGEY